MQFPSALSGVVASFVGDQQLQGKTVIQSTVTKPLGGNLIESRVERGLS